MDKNADGTVKGGGVEPEAAKQREVVYVLPESIPNRLSDSSIKLSEILSILWRGRWTLLIISVLGAVASTLYAISATEWYRSEVLLAPAESHSESPIGGQLGGIAALAGVNIRNSGSQKSLAVLKSRDFANEFISELDLLPHFFPDRVSSDAKVVEGLDPADATDIRDGIDFFHENVLRVREDEETKLVTVAVEWKDPNLAAEWAGALIGRLNADLRERSLRDAQSNVTYLRDELAKTNVLTIQQSIARLLEAELQKVMLAQGNTEFAFRVIDGPHVPKRRSRPSRAVIVVLGTVLFGTLATLLVLLIHSVKTREKARNEAETH